ncbi:MAG: proton-conducting transporter membrane subunit [Minwuia sp.]|uniref:proton-conducting transporter transmembrane domain-containing protein n=1 Tax=Minwuia sp. TaxID=2493630 RepID=UPI003A8C522C
MNLTVETQILLALAVPLIGMVLIGLTGRWPNLRETVTLITATVNAVNVWTILPVVLAGGRPLVSVIEILPGLPMKFEVEPLGMLFAAVAASLWIVNSIYSIGYMRGNKEVRQTRFYACFALAIAGAMGVAFAGNLLTLFIFYEVLTLSTYPLVTHKENDEARRGGRTYLGILIATSIGLQLPAIIWTWSLTGTMDFQPGGILLGHVQGLTAGLLLALYMYGIGKAALMPIHRWLPAAMVAPTPVSALLHAVAVVKAGVFTVIKVIVYIFGLELISTEPSTNWLIYAAAITLTLASLIAMQQDNLKRRLAYSTVSQLSYVILGAALGVAMGVVGAGMHIAMHAAGKITLFFCAGAIYVAAHKTEISDMKGLGRVMPVTMICFMIGALSVIGVPPLGGSWSKTLIMLGAADAGFQLMIGVLILSSLLNVAYLMPIPLRGFLYRPPGSPEGAPVKIHEAPLPCLIAIVITSLLCVALFFGADHIHDMLLPITETGGAAR